MSTPTCLFALVARNFVFVAPPFVNSRYFEGDTGRSTKRQLRPQLAICWHRSLERLISERGDSTRE